MVLLEGKSITKRIREELTEKVQSIKDSGLKTPKIVTVHIGTDSASEWYNKSIKKACENVGMGYELIAHKEISFDDAVKLIEELNNNEDIHGILINQPLPDHVQNLPSYLSPLKDIEGVTAANLGKLVLGEKTHIPCTPLAVMTIIEEYKIDLSGKRVLMLGRSNIVGKPLSLLLTQKNATVSLCHSKTKDLPDRIKESEVVVAAIGRAKYLQGDWLQEGAVVLDVGTNYSEDGKLVGDVDFESAEKKADMITPVPGGVGSLTNILLLRNCLDAYEDQV